MDNQQIREQAALGEYLGLLANPDRRVLLLGLHGGSEERASHDPVDLVGSFETPAVVRTELYHSHLPKLEAHGVIEWDRETGEIRPGPDWDDIAPLIDLLAENADRLPEGRL